MELFGGILAVKSVVFLTFSVFAIAAIGYAVGKITIKGINLGTAGVFTASCQETLRWGRSLFPQRR